MSDFSNPYPEIVIQNGQPVTELWKAIQDIQYQMNKQSEQIARLGGKGALNNCPVNEKDCKELYSYVYEIRDKIVQLESQGEKFRNDLSINVKEAESRLQQQYVSLETKISESNEEVQKALELLRNSSVQHSDKINKLESDCQMFCDNLATYLEEKIERRLQQQNVGLEAKISKYDQELQKIQEILKNFVQPAERITQLESYCQTLYGDLSTNVKQIDNRVQQQNVSFDAKIRECNDEIKKIQEPLTKNRFQAPESEKACLNSMLIEPSENMNFDSKGETFDDMKDVQSSNKLLASPSTTHSSHQRGKLYKRYIWETIKHLQREVTEGKHIVKKQDQKIANLKEKLTQNTVRLETKRLLHKLKVYGSESSDLLKIQVSGMTEKFSLMSGTLDDLQNKVVQIEKNVEKSRCDTSQIVTSVEYRFKQQLNDFETKISETNTQLNKIQELYRDKTLLLNYIKHITRPSQRINLSASRRVSRNNNADLPSQTSSQATTSRLEHGSDEEHPSQADQLEVESDPSTNPSSLNVAFLYNDKKLYTEKVLQKLGSDVVKNPHSLENAYLEEGALTSVINQPDIIFFFYFITNGREQFEDIQARVNTISNNFAKIPIYLILLKDENCRDLPLDKSKLQSLQVTIGYFTIYSQKFAEFVLTPEDFKKGPHKQKYSEVKTNYDELCNTMSKFIKS